MMKIGRGGGVMCDGYVGAKFSVGLVLVLMVAAMIPAVSAYPVGAQGLRPSSEWTVNQPATLPEIEAAIEKHRGETVTWVAYGGVQQASEREAFMKPLEQRFGIHFLEDTQPTNAKIKAMVDSGNVTWDTANLSAFQIWSLGKSGYLEPLDRRVVDTSKVLKALLSPWHARNTLWGTVLAYRRGVQKPRSWADFWNVKEFPGRRGYGDLLTGHLELPLLAAGLAPAKIAFPVPKEQEELIFRQLEELAPNITVFWSSGEQCPRLLISGELDYCSAWNGRINDAQKQGAPIEMCWQCGWVAGSGGNVILKGSRHKELAQLVIAWITFLPNNIQTAKYTGNVPAVEASALPEMMRLLRPILDARALTAAAGSPSNRPYMLLADEKWEGENFDRLNGRFQSIFTKRK
jgi:putative spermidine/putrescine transport system substrate-binding protein